MDSPVTVGGGKKKKKTKAKTVALTEFLADSSGSAFPVPQRTTSWADASEDVDSDGKELFLQSNSCLRGQNRCWY